MQLKSSSALNKIKGDLGWLNGVFIPFSDACLEEGVRLSVSFCTFPTSLHTHLAATAWHDDQEWSHDLTLLNNGAQQLSG